MGNTINPEDHLLHVKAWKSRSDYPVPSDYPENDLPELQDKPNTAIAFSGGGTRSYVGTIGFLAGLRDAGLLENIRYLGGVSSSSWAVAAFCYGKVKDDDVFLGPIDPPEFITFPRLDSMHPDSMRRLAATSIEFVFDGMMTITIDKQGAWNFTVAERFLKPVGIETGKYFTWSRQTLEDIFERNDHMMMLGITRSDFILPRRKFGPYMVLGWSLIGPDRSWIDDQYNAQHNHFRFIDVTPLYIGQFSNEYAHFNTEKFKIGGVVEPYCFALEGGLAPEFGLEYEETSGELLVPTPRKALDLSNAVSISSFNPGTIFDSYPIPFTELFLPFTANYFSPAFEDPQMRPTLFADGGAMQNIPLITFIQRGVEKIICVCNSYTPIDFDYLKDYGNPSNWVFSKSVRTGCIDISLASFFGIIPSDLILLHDISSEYGRNHIFETDLFAELIEGFHKASMTGKGIVYRSLWTTVDNPFYGVEGGKEVDVTFYYLEAPQQWMDSLPTDVREEVEREKNGLFDSFIPSFENFPYYDTDKFTLSYRETNLLANVVGWTVLENQKLFADVLSFNEPLRESTAAGKSSLFRKKRTASSVSGDGDGSSMYSTSTGRSELDRVKLGRSMHAKMAQQPRRDVDVALLPNNEGSTFDPDYEPSDEELDGPLKRRSTVKGGKKRIVHDDETGSQGSLDDDLSGLDESQKSNHSWFGSKSSSPKSKRSANHDNGEEFSMLHHADDVGENPLRKSIKKKVQVKDETSNDDMASNHALDNEGFGDNPLRKSVKKKVQAKDQASNDDMTSTSLDNEGFGENPLRKSVKKKVQAKDPASNDDMANYNAFDSEGFGDNPLRKSVKKKNQESNGNSSRDSMGYGMDTGDFGENPLRKSVKGKSKPVEFNEEIEPKEPASSSWFNTKLFTGGESAKQSNDNSNLDDEGFGDNPLRKSTKSRSSSPYPRGEYETEGDKSRDSIGSSWIPTKLFTYGANESKPNKSDDTLNDGEFGDNPMARKSMKSSRSTSPYPDNDFEDEIAPKSRDSGSGNSWLPSKMFMSFGSNESSNPANKSDNVMDDDGYGDNPMARKSVKSRSTSPFPGVPKDDNDKSRDSIGGSLFGGRLFSSKSPSKSPNPSQETDEANYFDMDGFGSNPLRKSMKMPSNVESKDEDDQSFDSSGPSLDPSSWFTGFFKPTATTKPAPTRPAPAPPKEDIKLPNQSNLEEGFENPLRAARPMTPVFHKDEYTSKKVNFDSNTVKMDKSFENPLRKAKLAKQNSMKKPLIESEDFSPPKDISYDAPTTAGKLFEPASEPFVVSNSISEPSVSETKVSLEPVEYDAVKEITPSEISREPITKPEEPINEPPKPIEEAKTESTFEDLGNPDKWLGAAVKTVRRLSSINFTKDGIVFDEEEPAETPPEPPKTSTTPFTAPPAATTAAATPPPPPAAPAEPPVIPEWITGIFTPIVETKPVETKPVETKPVAQPKPAEVKPVAAASKPSPAKAAETKPAAPKADDWFAPALGFASQFGLDIGSWTTETDANGNAGDAPVSGFSEDEMLAAMKKEEMHEMQSRERRSSLVVMNENPFDDIEATTFKVENLTDAKEIPPDVAKEMIRKMAGFAENKQRLQYLEKEKIPYLFPGDVLIKMLNTTESVRTRMAIVGHLGPRLIDPKQKMDPILAMFRFSEEKEKIREVIKARIQTLSSAIFNRGSLKAPKAEDGKSPGRGGAGRGGRGRGPGAAGRGAGSPRPETPSASEPSTEEKDDSEAKRAEELKAAAEANARLEETKRQEAEEKARLAAAKAEEEEKALRLDAEKKEAEEQRRQQSDREEAARLEAINREKEKARHDEERLQREKQLQDEREANEKARQQNESMAAAAALAMQKEREDAAATLAETLRQEELEKERLEKIRSQEETERQKQQEAADMARLEQIRRQEDEERNRLEAVRAEEELSLARDEKLKQEAEARRAEEEAAQIAAAALAEARRQAEIEAQAAEAETRRQAEAEARKAEADAAQATAAAAAEARRQAELDAQAEARRQAEVEARAAEVEARRQAQAAAVEAEARRKAEAEAQAAAMAAAAAEARRQAEEEAAETAAAEAEAKRQADEDESKRITERADFLALEERIRRAKENSLMRTTSIRYDSPPSGGPLLTRTTSIRYDSPTTPRSSSPSKLDPSIYSASHHDDSRGASPGPLEKIDHLDTAAKQIPKLRHLEDTLAPTDLHSDTSIPSTPVTPSASYGLVSESSSMKSNHPIYSYDELKQKFPPEGVDPSRKEEYLDDEVFREIFAMSKEEFRVQPKWKRDQQRKRYQLF